MSLAELIRPGGLLTPEAAATPFVIRLTDSMFKDPGFLELPQADRPRVVAEELFEIIRVAIQDHPRSQQVRIGPSEIGDECSRSLAYRIAGRKPPADRWPNWPATVGTAIHSWLEGVFSPHSDRYLLEQRVPCGQIAGQTISGSCDLFDKATGTVVDWKSKGKTTMLDHKRHGPGERYRAQFHSYGRGIASLGHKVNTVMGVFVPRDGKLHESYVWAERYNPDVAEMAFRRANMLYVRTQIEGLENVVESFPRCSDPYCDWCPTGPVWGAGPRPELTSLRQMIAAG